MGVSGLKSAESAGLTLTIIPAECSIDASALKKAGELKVRLAEVKIKTIPH